MSKHILTRKRSIIKEVEERLNEQIRLEASASAHYLGISSWCEASGHKGAAQFFYKQSEEERDHMMRIFRYLQEAGGSAIVSAIEQPTQSYKSLQATFEELLDHEIKVSNSINEIVALCLACGDYTTHHFLGWFLAEQREEEAKAREALALFEKYASSPIADTLIDKKLAALTEKE